MTDFKKRGQYNGTKFALVHYVPLFILKKEKKIETERFFKF